MSDKDKKAEDIIEETMQEIFDDLKASQASDDEESNPETEEEAAVEEEEIDLAEQLDRAFGDESPEKAAEDTEDIEKEEELEDAESLYEEDFDENSEDEDVEYLDEEEDSDEDSDEEDLEETEAEREYRKHMRRKKAGKIAAIVIGVIAVIYIGIALYFESHFMFYTKINGTDVAMKNVSQVEEQMKQQVKDYVLTLEESDGDTEEIVGSAISAEYVPGKELKKLVKNQNNFLWITSLWDHPKITAEVGVQYDETALAEVIEGLACMKAENQVASVNAHPEFKDTKFEIVPEVIGTQIDSEKFNEAITEAIDGFQDTLNLSETESYIRPKFFSDSEEVIKAAEAMNSYLGANITYDMNPNKEVVDSAVISQWVKVNDNMEVTFDEEAVKSFVKSLAEKYDTKGKAREFKTATGQVVTVEGGSYGWKINQTEEYTALINNIKNAEVVTREPAYSSKAAVHGSMDMGSTYAEVDLTNQKAYFIKDGVVVLESNIVTGNPNKGYATPQGVYSLSYKTRNAVLRGEKRPDGTYSYESPVKYWMPFNGGIGFHDASWQSSFGGSRYKTHGSHGCINMPTEKAAQMYEYISQGTPVVCHY